MTNRSDLFDEPDGRAAQQPAEAAPAAQEPPPPSQEPPPSSSDGGNGRGTGVLTRENLNRRNFLRGAGAAAVAGAVVGAGVAIGVTSGGDDETAGTQDRDGMTLGAPSNREVAEAVIKLTVNGKDHWLGVSANETLAEVLRRKMGLTGTKIGCDRSECSACTVMVNGVAMNSCSLLAIREDGKQIQTIEGLSEDGALSNVQQAFLDHMGLQCGFCTPGQVVQATAFLARNAKPSEDEIRHAMSGNLCKCAAYTNILAAVQQAASKGSV